MAILLYCDEDSMRHALVDALQSRGMDVTTALDANMSGHTDEEHLEHASRQGRVLFSFNRRDFMRLHTEYLTNGKSHAGIILANQQQFKVGEVMRRILRLSTAKTPQEMVNQIEFLSRWR